MNKLLLSLFCLAGLQQTALCEPTYYLIPTYENAAETTVDFRLWSVKIPGDPRVSGTEVGIGHGVTRAWYTELLIGYLHTPQTGTRRSDFAWQNDFLLTQGQYPFDLALHTTVRKYRAVSAGAAIEYFGEGGGLNLEFGPILQTDFGRIQANANLLFDRTYRTASAAPLQMKYQWQLKYRWTPILQPGLQGFGELGDWDHWAPRHEQSHRVGPVIAGSLPLGTAQSLKYEASYLTGSVFAEHAKTFSMRVQYVF